MVSDDTVSGVPEGVTGYARVRTDDRGRARLGPEHANRSLFVTIEGAYEVRDLPVYYAHYKADLSVAGNAKMIAERRVGMDHNTGPLDALSDYSGNPKGDANALRDAAHNPVLVVGDPGELAPDRRLIGISSPQGISHRQYEHVDRDEGEDIPDAPLSAAGGDTPGSRDLLTERPDTPRVWMKTIQLDPEQTVVVTKDEAPALWENPPRNTITRRDESRWPEAHDAYLEATYPNPR